MLSTFAQSTYYYDNPSYYTNGSNLTPEQTTAMAMFMLFFFFIAMIVSVAMYVLASVCLMRIFKKAGIQPWIAWIPIYNSWKLLEIGGQQGFWAVLAIIPVINIVSAVFMYIAMYNIGLKLGKSGSFVLLAIFLSPVWLIWLAFDKSVWDDDAGAPSLAGEAEPVTAPHTHHTNAKHAARK